MSKATSILVSLFVESPVKFVITSGEEGEFQPIDNLMCFSPDFETYFAKLYDEYDTVDTIWVVGNPEDFIQPFVDKIKAIVKPNVHVMRVG